MRRLSIWLLIVAFTGLSAGESQAQMGAGQTMPGPRSQTLSPYLNMLGGGNRAVNFYNGVMPGLQANSMARMGGQNQSGPRLTFFPVVDTLSDLDDNPRDASVVNPSGHPVGFGNTMGYFGPTSGQMFSKNAGQQQPMTMPLSRTAAGGRR